jgi:hypothetical protein
LSKKQGPETTVAPAPPLPPLGTPLAANKGWSCNRPATANAAAKTNNVTEVGFFIEKGIWQILDLNVNLIIPIFLG